MAGVSFTLERMARGDRLGGLAAAYGHGALIVAGPWIFTMIGLAGASFAVCGDGCVNVAVYRSIVIYNSAFALAATSPIAFAASRFVADRIYFKRLESLPFALIASLGLYAALALPCAGCFYGWMAALSLPERIAATQNLILLGFSWLMIPFLGALRSANGVTAAFATGAALMVAIAWLMPGGEPFFLLEAFNIGAAAIDAILLGLIVRRCGGTIVVDPAVWTSLRRHWELPLIGLTYGLGLWVDKAIMWTMAPGEKLRVAAALVTMPAYDTPMFVAQLAALPVLAGFFIHAETRTLRLFRRLHDTIAGGGSLREIEQAAAALTRFMTDAIGFLLERLGAIALLGALLSFFAVEALGFQPDQIGVLRVALFGMAFSASAMFCVILLLYADLRRAALLATTVYLVLNAALTVLLLPLGFRFYGYGAFLAAVVEFVIAYACWRRESPWLLYHVFVTNNASVGDADA